MADFTLLYKISSEPSVNEEIMGLLNSRLPPVKFNNIYILKIFHCRFICLWVYDGKNRKTTVATVILITDIESD